MSILSDALGYQFWPINTNTFNESIPVFADYIPYIHESQSDDPIKLQVADEPDPSVAYQLEVTDKDSNTLLTLDFVKSPTKGPKIVPVLQFDNQGFTGSILPWVNLKDFNSYVGNLSDFWTWVGVGDVFSDTTASGSRTTSLFTITRPDAYVHGWPPGDYEIQFEINNASTGPDAGTLHARILSTLGNFVFPDAIDQADIINIATGPRTLTFFFTLLEYTNKLGIYLDIASPGNTTKVHMSHATILEAPTNETYYEHDITTTKVLFLNGIQFQNKDFVGSMSPWIQDGNPLFDAVWNWVSDNNLQAFGSFLGMRTTQTSYAPAPLGFSKWPPGTYSIRVQGGNNTVVGSGSTNINAVMVSNETGLRNDDVSLNSILNIVFSGFDITFNFTLEQETNYLGINFFSFNNTAEIRVVLSHFTINSFADVKDYLRFYIQKATVRTWKSEVIKFSNQLVQNSSWGSKLVAYKSVQNFAGIRYPNDGGYFYLRVPCQFFRQRPKGSQESLPLSGNQVIGTSIVKGIQQFMKTIYLPDYMHNKIELALQHSVGGTVLIDEKFWALEEAYEPSPPDEKSTLQMGKVWLSDSNYSIRKMI